MSLRPYWQFYKDCAPFIAVFTILCIALFGVFWGFSLCITLGVVVGFLAFGALKNQEYYTYYNLGITKFKLLKIVFLINCVVSIPIFIVFYLLSILILGNPTT